MHRTVSLILTIVFSGLASAVFATTLNPDLGQPVRDASVLRAPDGTFYLTGTTAGKYEGRGLDWQNNRGVRVWSSRNLTDWTDLGFIWDLHTNPEIGHGARWQTELYPDPDGPSGVRVRGMTAPRLAHDGERFWITYSMNGYGAGAMPGEASVDGRYLNTRVMHEISAAPTDKCDASLFTDVDGEVYLVWGGGCVAKVRDLSELEKMAVKGENEVGVEEPVHYLFTRVAGWPNLTGVPQQGSPYGVSVFHDGSNYHFTFTATTLRGGKIYEDSFICTARSLLGSYSAPKPLVLDSGRVTLFAGADGRTLMAYSDRSDKAVIRPLPSEPPAIADVPVAAVRGDAPGPLAPRQRFQRPDDVPLLLDVVKPLISDPLRDASVAQGPDGTSYLVGTEPSRTADGKLDWSNNRGIRLWSSRNRKEWRDHGLVFDCDRDGDEAHKRQNLDTTIGVKAMLGRAVTAPEIQYHKGDWWIVYSLNGQGIRLLRAKTPEGPWSQHAVLTRQGRDPSLFIDGAEVFLVWGAGFIAPLNDSLTALEGEVRTLFTNVNWNPRYMRRPELMGLWGSHLIKQGPWYVWTFSTRTGRNGVNAIDTMASWAKSLDGPFADPCTMLPNGGQADIEPDGEGGWLASFSGEDEMSELPFRPSLTAVVTNGDKPGSPLKLRPMRDDAVFTSWQMVNGYDATWLDLWIGHPDFVSHALRDVFIFYDEPTDSYYMTGSFWGEEDLRRGAVLYSSKDLMHWTSLGYNYRVSSLAKDGFIADENSADFEELVREDAKGEDWRFRIQVGEQKIWKLDGEYYMNMQVFSRRGGVGGHYLLKSTSGSIAGPYKPVNEIIGVADVMQDKDGSVLLNFGGTRTRRFPTAREFITKDKSDWRSYPFIDHSHTEDWLKNITFSEDCEAGIMLISGKYVTWSTDWTGSYDGIYRFADNWEGPYNGAMRILPFGGNGKFFQTRDGQWMYGYFYNSNEYASRGQNAVRANIYPVHVGFEKGELIIEPVALRQNRDWINKNGPIWHRPM